jgi:hypothetical protein
VKTSKITLVSPSVRFLVQNETNDDLISYLANDKITVGLDEARFYLVALSQMLAKTDAIYPSHMLVEERQDLKDRIQVLKDKIKLAEDAEFATVSSYRYSRKAKKPRIRSLGKRMGKR